MRERDWDEGGGMEVARVGWVGGWDGGANKREVDEKGIGEGGSGDGEEDVDGVASGVEEERERL